MNERLAPPPADFIVDPTNAWECAYLARRLGVAEDALRAAAVRLGTPTLESVSRCLDLH